MSGSKSFDGFILVEELLPELDRLVSEECLLVASRTWKIAAQGFDRDSIQAGTRLALYPPSPNITAQEAMDLPGPSRSILVDLPVLVGNMLPMLRVGARFDWLENDRVIVDRDVVPRFDRLRRRLLKVMCLGPWEGFKSGTGVTTHVYRGSHFSSGALEWFLGNGEWVQSAALLSRFRPKSE
jgi:hypothetical protein